MKRIGWMLCCWMIFGLIQAETRSFTLQWQAPCAVSDGTTTIYRPCFDGDLPHDGLPYFHCATRGSGQADIRLSDAVFEPCPAADAALLAQHALADTLLIRQYCTNERGRRQIEVELLPLRYCDGHYQRLVSGTLEIRTPAALRAPNPTNSYAAHSLLRSGRWVKISVRQNGMHALTYSELQAMGFPNPAAVRVFGYGGYPVNDDFNLVFPRQRDDLTEVPTVTATNLSGEQQIVFYAVGATQVYYDPIAAFYRRVNNPYSDYGYYFLTADAGSGPQPSEADYSDREVQSEVSLTSRCQLYEDDRFNLLLSGQEFLGDKFSAETPSRSYSFDFPGRMTSMVHLYIRMAGNSSTNTYFDLTTNGYTDYDCLRIGKLTAGNSAIVGVLNSDYFGSDNDRVTVNLQYKPNAPGDVAYLDYILANTICALNLPAEGQIRISHQSGYSPGDYVRYTVSNANARMQVWNVDTPESPSRMVGELNGENFSFVAPCDYLTDRNYMAFDPASTSLYKPSFVGEVVNQDLHGLGATDMVILSPAAYLSEANRLADYHRSHDGLTVAVVTPEQAYNEFTSGTPDPAAYRLLMKMLYDRAAGDEDKMPRSLLLMGVSTYDNRGRKLPRQEILSYQAPESFKTDVTYSTDDYFGFLDDTEGNNFNADKLDIAVGRLPVYSLSELKAVVDKIISYSENTHFGPWRNQLLFLGDDGDDNMHMTQADNLSDSLSLINGGYQHTKVLLDAYPLVQSASGGSFPAAREKVLNGLQSGALIFTYVGHSSPNTLSAEQTINRNDIINMYNLELAFWLTASCEFSRFDDGKVSAGMQVLTTPHAGIGLISAARVVYSDQNYALMRLTNRHLIPRQGEAPLTIGEIYRRGKVAMGENGNKLRYFLFADPELTLNYPRQTVVTDSINHQTPENAQMQALGLITLQGHVDDGSGQADESFNGTVNVTVYDKAESLSTLANKGTTPPYTYTDYPNILFRGNGIVKNGRFSLEFMVPKDISYRMDLGRMAFYAANEAGETDANGFDQSFTVGGSDSDAESSDYGPSARIYLNTPAFVSGQEVESAPVFYAHTYDRYGINAVGAGIGHDITLTLNNSRQYSYILNDYYESNLGDYKSGRIAYQLPELPDGSYQLDFKVWNLQNVSTHRSLQFVVRHDTKPVLDAFYCTPNPASDRVRMIYTYDRPNEPVEAEFTVYNLHGQCCWQQTVTEFSDGQAAVVWDLNDASSANLGSGIYPVKLKITTKDGAYCYKTLKLVLHRR